MTPVDDEALLARTRELIRQGAHIVRSNMASRNLYVANTKEVNQIQWSYWKTYAEAKHRDTKRRYESGNCTPMFKGGERLFKMLAIMGFPLAAISELNEDRRGEWGWPHQLQHMLLTIAYKFDVLMGYRIDGEASSSDPGAAKVHGDIPWVASEVRLVIKFFLSIGLSADVTHDQVALVRDWYYDALVCASMYRYATGVMPDPSENEVRQAIYNNDAIHMQFFRETGTISAMEKYADNEFGKHRPFQLSGEVHTEDFVEMVFEEDEWEIARVEAAKAQVAATGEPMTMMVMLKLPEQPHPRGSGLYKKVDSGDSQSWLHAGVEIVPVAGDDPVAAYYVPEEQKMSPIIEATEKLMFMDNRNGVTSAVGPMSKEERERVENVIRDELGEEDVRYVEHYNFIVTVTTDSPDQTDCEHLRTRMKGLQRKLDSIQDANGNPLYYVTCSQVVDDRDMLYIWIHPYFAYNNTAHACRQLYLATQAIAGTCSTGMRPEFAHAMDEAIANFRNQQREYTRSTTCDWIRHFRDNECVMLNEGYFNFPFLFELDQKRLWDAMADARVQNTARVDDNADRWFSETPGPWIPQCAFASIYSHAFKNAHLLHIMCLAKFTDSLIVYGSVAKSIHTELAKGPIDSVDKMTRVFGESGERCVDLVYSGPLSDEASPFVEFDRMIDALENSRLCEVHKTYEADGTARDSPVRSCIRSLLGMHPDGPRVTETAKTMSAYWLRKVMFTHVKVGGKTVLNISVLPDRHVEETVATEMIRLVLGEDPVTEYNSQIANARNAIYSLRESKSEILLIDKNKRTQEQNRFLKIYQDSITIWTRVLRDNQKIAKGDDPVGVIRGPVIGVNGDTTTWRKTAIRRSADISRVVSYTRSKGDTEADLSRRLRCCEVIAYTVKRFTVHFDYHLGIEETVFMDLIPDKDLDEILGNVSQSEQESNTEYESDRAAYEADKSSDSTEIPQSHYRVRDMIEYTNGLVERARNIQSIDVDTFYETITEDLQIMISFPLMQMVRNLLLDYRGEMTAPDTDLVTLHERSAYCNLKVASVLSLKNEYSSLRERYTRDPIFPNRETREHRDECAKKWTDELNEVTAIPEYKAASYEADVSVFGDDMVAVSLLESLSPWLVREEPVEVDQDEINRNTWTDGVRLKQVVNTENRKMSASELEKEILDSCRRTLGEGSQMATHLEVEFMFTEIRSYSVVTWQDFTSDINDGRMPVEETLAYTDILNDKEQTYIDFWMLQCELRTLLYLRDNGIRIDGDYSFEEELRNGTLEALVAQLDTFKRNAGHRLLYLNLVSVLLLVAKIRQSRVYYLQSQYPDTVELLYLVDGLMGHTEDMVSRAQKAMSESDAVIKRAQMRVAYAVAKTSNDALQVSDFLDIVTDHVTKQKELCDAAKNSSALLDQSIARIDQHIDSANAAHKAKEEEEASKFAEMGSMKERVEEDTAHVKRVRELEQARRNEAAEREELTKNQTKLDEALTGLTNLQEQLDRKLVKLTGDSYSRVKGDAHKKRTDAQEEEGVIRSVLKEMENETHALETALREEELVLQNIGADEESAVERHRVEKRIADLKIQIKASNAAHVITKEFSKTEIIGKPTTSERKKRQRKKAPKPSIVTALPEATSPEPAIRNVTELPEITAPPASVECLREDFARSKLELDEAKKREASVTAKRNAAVGSFRKKLEAELKEAAFGVKVAERAVKESKEDLDKFYDLPKDVNTATTDEPVPDKTEPQTLDATLLRDIERCKAMIKWLEFKRGNHTEEDETKWLHAKWKEVGPKQLDKSLTREDRRRFRAEFYVYYDLWECANRDARNVIGLDRSEFIESELSGEHAKLRDLESQLEKESSDEKLPELVIEEGALQQTASDDTIDAIAESVHENPKLQESLKELEQAQSELEETAEVANVELYVNPHRRNEPVSIPDAKTDPVEQFNCTEATDDEIIVRLEELSSERIVAIEKYDAVANKPDRVVDTRGSQNERRRKVEKNTKFKEQQLAPLTAELGRINEQIYLLEREIRSRKVEEPIQVEEPVEERPTYIDLVPYREHGSIIECKIVLDHRGHVRIVAKDDTQQEYVSQWITELQLVQMLFCKTDVRTTVTQLRGLRCTADYTGEVEFNGPFELVLKQSALQGDGKLYKEIKIALPKVAGLIRACYYCSDSMTREDVHVVMSEDVEVLCVECAPRKCARCSEEDDTYHCCIYEEGDEEDDECYTFEAPDYHPIELVKIDLTGEPEIDDTVKETAEPETPKLQASLEKLEQAQNELDDAEYERQRNIKTTISLSQYQYPYIPYIIPSDSKRHFEMSRHGSVFEVSRKNSIRIVAKSVQGAIYESPWFTESQFYHMMYCRANVVKTVTKVGELTCTVTWTNFVEFNGPLNLAFSREYLMVGGNVFRDISHALPDGSHLVRMCKACEKNRNTQAHMFISDDRDALCVECMEKKIPDYRPTIQVNVDLTDGLAPDEASEKLDEPLVSNPELKETFKDLEQSLEDLKESDAEEDPPPKPQRERARKPIVETEPVVEKPKVERYVPLHRRNKPIVPVRNETAPGPQAIDASTTNAELEERLRKLHAESKTVSDELYHVTKFIQDQYKSHRCNTPAKKLDYARIHLRKEDARSRTLIDEDQNLNYQILMIHEEIARRKDPEARERKLRQEREKEDRFRNHEQLPEAVNDSSVETKPPGYVSAMNRYGKLIGDSYRLKHKTVPEFEDLIVIQDDDVRLTEKRKKVMQKYLEQLQSMNDEIEEIEKKYPSMTENHAMFTDMEAKITKKHADTTKYSMVSLSKWRNEDLDATLKKLILFVEEARDDPDAARKRYVKEMTLKKGQSFTATENDITHAVKKLNKFHKDGIKLISHEIELRREIKLEHEQEDLKKAYEGLGDLIAPAANVTEEPPAVWEQPASNVTDGHPGENAEERRRKRREEMLEVQRMRREADEAHEKRTDNIKQAELARSTAEREQRIAELAERKERSVLSRKKKKISELTNRRLTLMQTKTSLEKEYRSVQAYIKQCEKELSNTKKNIKSVGYFKHHKKMYTAADAEEDRIRIGAFKSKAERESAQIIYKLQMVEEELYNLP